jgi:hypothetical protein
MMSFGFNANSSSDPGTPIEPPISYDDLRQLFDFLNRPNPPECDHSHRETIEFLHARRLPILQTIAWLKDNGGFCDCEVIYNVADRWDDKINWIPIEDEEDEGPA